MKKVMVLSATYWQIPLIKRLKEEGHWVAAVSPVKDSPAFPFADDVYYIDILDKEKCLELARDLQIDAVMSDECDIANPTIAYISDKMNLMSVGEEHAHLYTDKFAMREFCRSQGFDFPEYKKCYSKEEAEDFFERMQHRMIMKPLDSNSSRGVVTICNKEDIKDYFDATIAFSKIEKAVLCERYIDGPEFTIDGIKTSKGHTSLIISEKKHFEHNRNIACTLFFSHSNPIYDYDELRAINDMFVERSQLNYGLTHAEYKYENGRWYLIEIGCRGGGNLISSDIVPAISGVDNYGYLISKTLKETCAEEMVVEEDCKEKCAVLQFLETPAEGIVKDIIGIDMLEKDPRVIAHRINCSVGDYIELAKNDSCRIGFYIAVEDSRDQLEQLMECIRQSVYIVV